MWIRRFRTLGLAGTTVAAMLLAGATGTSAQSVVPAQTPADQGISVVGAGTVTAQPDVALVQFGVEETNKSLAAALSAASNDMAQVIAKLKAAGIQDTDIQTVAFNVQPQYDNSQTLTGYRVDNVVQAKSSDLNGLGSLIDSVVAAGATRVNGIQFQASDPSGLKAQARDLAMQDAQAKAQQIAKDAGVTLGKVVLVEESDASGVTPQPAVPQLASSAPAQAVTTPVQPGQLQVSTQVRVVWSIQ